MSHRDEYKQWPFLTQDEFDLACAYFDQKYVRASLGPTRHIFKMRSRRTLTAGISYLEILRLLQLPEDDDELSAAFAKLSGNLQPAVDTEMLMAEDADHEVLRSNQVGDPDALPGYSVYALQPYVTYEVHLHPTYRLPTLWFTLHDLPMGESAFDVEAVYRYLIPSEFKSRMRDAGVMGGISAAPHPLTDVPAFFIHPCQTKEGLEGFECPLKDYMLLWLGLVGGCVGLSVPLEMAQSDL